jgi:hypothetical protein
MYIEYEVICFYGIYFTYDEIKNNESLNNNKIELQTIWNTFKFPIISPYYEADKYDLLYCVGEKLGYKNLCYTNRCYGYKLTIEEMKEWCDKLYKTNEKIKNFCENYNLEYKIPKINMMPSIE